MAFTTLSRPIQSGFIVTQPFYPYSTVKIAARPSASTTRFKLIATITDDLMWWWSKNWVSEIQYWRSTYVVATRRLTLSRTSNPAYADYKQLLRTPQGWVHETALNYTTERQERSVLASLPVVFGPGLSIRITIPSDF